MFVVITVEFKSDLVYIPDSLQESPQKMQRKFTKWIHDKSIEHAYWVYKDGRKYGVSFNIDAFIKWLNENAFLNSSDKVKVVEENISSIPKELIRLYF